jgi:N-acetylmuramic acid 6-phosphate etherase
MSEDPHPRADELGGMSTIQLLEVMQGEDLGAVEAVGRNLAQVARAVDAISARIRQGGRLHYFGAGTSGRLAALDAAECAPTFGLDPDLVHAHDAGDGEAEDDDDRGRDEAHGARLGPNDAVVGVSASGRTAYVLAATQVARAAGALVVGLSSAPGSPLGPASDIAIEIETGPEVIAGSTRLKAGTVQKVILNMISTGVFVRLGQTYRGRMVGVVAANDKLRRRAARIVSELTGASDERVDVALAGAGGNARIAVLMLRCGLSVPEASARLAAAAGDLALALGEGKPG